jgi:hypothetical protein
MSSKGYILDYSIESLNNIDKIIEYYERRILKSKEKLSLGLESYIGETLIQKSLLVYFFEVFL